MDERTPIVGRPRGPAWRALQADGIVWEGQAFLVGGDVDLATRLIVTRTRLAFARGGAVILEVPRTWLHPLPRLLPDDTLELSIAPDDTEPAETLRLRIGDAQPADELLALLSSTDDEASDTPPTPGLVEAVEDWLAAPVSAPWPEPVPLPPPDDGRRRGWVWALSLTGLFLVLAVGTWLGRDHLPLGDTDGGARLPAATVEATATATPPLPTATITLGVGGSSATAMPTPDPTATPEPTATATTEPTATIEPTKSPTPTSTPLPTSTPSPTATATATAPPTAPPTATATPEPTATATPEPSPTNTATPTPTNTATPTPTETPVPTATETPTPSPSPTATATLAPTATATPSSTATSSPSPTSTATPLPTATSTPEPTATATPEPTATPSPTATATATPEPTATATPEPTATATPEPTATATPTVPSTPSPTATATATATQVPTATPTNTPSPDSSQAIGESITPAEEATPTETPSPTASPTLEPTATETPSPTATETPSPTATETPVPTATETPSPTATATPEPTATATATPEPTAPSLPEPPPTSTPGPTPTATATPLPTQPPSIGAGEVPEQAAVDEAFRYTVESAMRSATIDELALPPLGIGEWVVVVVQARNWSDQAAVMDMSRFALVAGGPTGAPVPLDPTSGDLARFLGFSPAYASDDAVLFAPGESHRLALLFQVSAEAGELALVAGDAWISLNDAFAASADVTALGDPPVEPDLVSATVTKVIDGRTIEVELNGVLTEIAYLGIEVPTGEECGAAEATAINNTLVAGRTVWLERERRNTDAHQRLLRDVWLVNADGSRVLVAAILVAEGAAIPAPTDPDVRYAGWLGAASDAARAEGAGQWGSCAT